MYKRGYKVALLLFIFVLVFSTSVSANGIGVQDGIYKAKTYENLDPEGKNLASGTSKQSEIIFSNFVVGASGVNISGSVNGKPFSLSGGLKNPKQRLRW